ncbi:MAG: family 43 glycosylhydrolase [Clostridiales bacterium]|nr:family 43 glycosylhydrolase [Clostridiales bacterium]
MKDATPVNRKNQNVTVKGRNPILGMDFPDPDVIYADGCFYMISTTMHFFPGGQILRSYDLVHWEHAAYVFDSIDGTPAQKLTGEENIYGKGMWAGCIRYHNGEFFVAFSCNDTQKTYLYRADSIEGPWRKNIVEGYFYYDLSMLFDEDRVYMIHGHKEVFITELNSELTGPKEGGLHRLLISDKDNPILGYEGSHMYKINGEYWLFSIHSLASHWKRVEAAFHAGSLEDDFKGGDVLNFSLPDRPDGFAQGGVVEGPEGVWHAVLFRDNGAVGRIPVVTGVSWITGDKGVELIASEEFETTDLKPGYEYAPLYGSDDFSSATRRDFWQFNHEPVPENVCFGNGELAITTDKVCDRITSAHNTLTQRMKLPECAAEVTIDGTDMKNGDVAGLAAFQGDYGYVGIMREEDRFFAVFGQKPEDGADEICERVKLDATEDFVPPKLRVRLEARFGEKDEAECFFLAGKKWRKIGPVHPLSFRLDHFTGCRFGLFYSASLECGGTARFSAFVYE